MTLATRCPSCHTTFRVVKDQLRLAEGWVRCGRCEDIFRATDHLVDLTGPPRAPSAETHQVRDQEATVSAVPGPELPEPAVPTSAFPVTELMDMVEPRWAPEPDPEPPTPGPGDNAASTHASQQDLRHFAWEQGPTAAPMARWLRVTLGALVLISTLTLLAQATWTFREPLARQGVPVLPTLYSLCAPWGCEATPLADLDGLVIESSELTRLAGGVHLLNLTLRNRRSMDLRMPALELTLTDATGAVLLRRVVEPRDWGYLGQTLGAQAEAPIRLGLDAGQRLVAGYSLELFYP